jgi:hypothetical protein
MSALFLIPICWLSPHAPALWIPLLRIAAVRHLAHGRLQHTVPAGRKGIDVAIFGFARHVGRNYLTGSSP